MADDEIKYIFRCPLCGEEFDNPLSLGVHLMSAHSDWKPEDMNETENPEVQNTEENPEKEEREEEKQE